MVVLEECSSSFSSSSSSIQLWTYDVFLSFRGSDNRNNFTAHLNDALRRRGIKTYMDDELNIGEEISEALLKAIENSSIAIIVLSKNYADSRWCLDELIKILECKEKQQQMVVPIFYDVEPSEVRNQAGSVGKAFAKLEAKFMDDVKLQRWKRALKKVADLSGCHLQNREEIRRESPNDPGRRSRLWDPIDVRRVLEENTGTNKIEGILVALPKEEEIQLNPKVFRKMEKLRLFLNKNATFSKTPDFLSNELRVLHWSGFSGKFWPSNFHGRNLIELIMCKSNIKTYRMIQNFGNLVSISFQECKSLIEIPDLSMISNLEIFNVTNCKNLKKIHPPIASLDKLVRLEFHNCPNLKTFWRGLQLRSLQYLTISKCRRLRHFPEIECPMECLEKVQLTYNCIEELPSSWKLTSGMMLDLSGCPNIENLLNIIYWSQSKPSIESTTFCNVGRSFPMAPECFSGFVELNLSETDIISLPMCIQDCCKLRTLQLNRCRELKEISRLPPYLAHLFAEDCRSLKKLRLDARDSPWIQRMWVSGCEVLEDLANDVESFVLRERHASAEEKRRNYPILDFSFPGYEIPDWFSYKKVVNGNSSEMDVIDLPNLDWKIKGIAFCFVFRKQNTQTAKPDGLQWGFDVICGGSKIYTLEIPMFNSEWGNICVLYYDLEPFKMKGDGMHVHLRHLTEVPLFESWGVHLVRGYVEKAADSIWNPHDVENTLEDVDDNSDASDDDDDGYLTCPESL